MPDITMCDGTDCPLKGQCYRNQAVPNACQSWFSVAPYKDGACEHFLERWLKQKVRPSDGY